MGLNKKVIVYVVNVDWFFISHRLPLAEEALKKGYEVCLIAKNTGEFPFLEQMGIRCFNLHFDRSGRNPIKELLIILGLYRYYKKIHPNIIHHVTLKPSIYGTIATKLTSHKSKVINAVTGFGYIFTAERESASKWLLISIMKFAFGTKNGNFIFQNPDDRDLCAKLGFLNKKNNIIIKGSGVDPNKYQLKHPIDINKEEWKVVLLARMLKDKGIYEFVEAAKLLKEELKGKVLFLLVGGIDAHNPARFDENEILDMCDSGYVEWLGYKTNVIEIYTNADIVCLPSYREGLPKSLIEAMAIGCPIITTDAVGCRECVVDGINGFLVPIGDKRILADRIRYLIKNPEKINSMGLESRKKMEREMSLQEVVSKTFDFYES